MNTSPASEPTAPSAPELLIIAQNATNLAAKYIRELDRDNISREYKTSSHDIVTEHDRACEQLIVESLQEQLPGCRIVGEEGGERGGTKQRADGSAANVTFYVDPIDGTSNFAAGLPLFCISVGVAVGHELVAGVIDAPILNQVFTASDGPAFLNGQRLPVVRTRYAEDALVLSGYPGHRIAREFPGHAGAIAVDMVQSFSAVRQLGTAALELAYVAAGWADATCLSQINSWDVAAGFHIVRQAGGSIRTWPGTGPVDAPPHEQPAYVACAGAERLERLDSMMDELQALRDTART